MDAKTPQTTIIMPKQTLMAGGGTLRS